MKKILVFFLAFILYLNVFPAKAAAAPWYPWMGGWRFGCWEPYRYAGLGVYTSGMNMYMEPGAGGGDDGLIEYLYGWGGSTGITVHTDGGSYLFPGPRWNPGGWYYMAAGDSSYVSFGTNRWVYAITGRIGCNDNETAYLVFGSYCPANQACPSPSSCGYPGGYVASPGCQRKYCSATPACCTNSAPGQVTLASPTNGSTGNPMNPTLSWNAPSSWGTYCSGNVNRYKLYFGTAASPPLYQSNLSSPSFTLSGLTANTTYYWKVVANNGYADGTASQIYSFKTSVAPVITNVTINSPVVMANNSTQYTITATATDADGGSTIANQYALINLQGEYPTPRGFLSWGAGNYWPSLKDSRSCTLLSGSGGGGYAAIQANYGDTHLRLDSCTTSISGVTRTVSFVVRFDTSYTTPTTDNDISGYVADSTGLTNGWTNFQTDFSVCPTNTTISGNVSFSNALSYPVTISTNKGQTLSTGAGNYTLTVPSVDTYTLSSSSVAGFVVNPASYPNISTTPPSGSCSGITGKNFYYTCNQTPSCSAWSNCDKATHLQTMPCTGLVCGQTTTRTQACSDAGIIQSGTAVDAGSGKFSMGGTDPGFRLRNYDTNVNTNNVSYSNFMSTVFNNSGIANQTQLDTFYNRYSGVYPALASPAISGGGKNYRFWAISNTTTLDSVLAAIIARNETGTIHIIVPWSSYDPKSSSISSAKNISANLRIIAFINGSLTVNANVTSDTANLQSAMVFLLNNSGALDVGNLTIDPAVSRLDGMYLFPGAFADGYAVRQLTGYGSLISLGPTDIGEGFTRSFYTGPAEQWFFQSKYLQIFKNVLAVPKYTWSELAPSP